MTRKCTKVEVTGRQRALLRSAGAQQKHEWILYRVALKGRRFLFGTDFQTFRLSGGTAAARKSPALTVTLLFFLPFCKIFALKNFPSPTPTSLNSLFIFTLLHDLCVTLCVPLGRLFLSLLS